MDKSPVEKIKSEDSSQSKPKLIRYSDTLKPGSPVLVRIIGPRGKNAYEGSVAGVRLIIHSTKELKPGDTFKGILGLKNGGITITPANITDAPGIKDISTLQIIETGNLYESVTSPALASLLASLNLPADNLSFNILLQFKQLGMRLDSALMRKIRRAAEKAENPEEKLEELISREQKKVYKYPSENSNQNSFSDKPDFTEEDREKNNETTNPYAENIRISENDWLSEIKSFITSLVDGSIPNDYGNLTVLNHTGFFKDKSSENSWVTIPFEIINTVTETKPGNGKIMLLLGSSDKNFRLMNLHVNYKDVKWRFIINRNITSISFSAEGILNPELETEKLRNHFLKSGKEVQIHFIPFEKADGTGYKMEDFKLAEGNI